MPPVSRNHRPSEKEKGETTIKTARTLITICLLFTAATLFAQSETQWLMKVHIPYSFSVADQSFPAGIYNIYSVTAARMIRITSVDGKHTTIVNTLANYTGKAASTAHLVFAQYGNEYFLTEIWSGGDDLSRNPPLGKKATELATSSASGPPKGDSPTSSAARAPRGIPHPRWCAYRYPDCAASNARSSHQSMPAAAPHRVAAG